MRAHQRTSPRRPGCGNRRPKNGRSVAGKRETGGTARTSPAQTAQRPNGASQKSQAQTAQGPNYACPNDASPNGANGANGANGGVIPSGAAQRRRRGIAILPVEGPPARDECDSAPPALQACARNDSR